MPAEEKLWDPLRRKYVTATPEEQVRQWFILQLRDVFGVPFHAMRSEVSLHLGSKPFRADIVVYGRDASEVCIVECKRPDVPLNSEVVDQILRYNLVLGVRFLVLINGKLTYIYALNEGHWEPLKAVPTYKEMLCRAEQ